MKSASSKRVAVVVAAFGFIGGLGGMSRADDLADLARLAQAEGDEYVRIRNALIERRSAPWDIAAAAAQSWELALAAYILEERTKEVEAFKTLDRAIPSSYRSVAGYGRLSRSRDANMAFLLEKLWKAPNEWEKPPWGITPERDRQYAYNTMTYSGRVAAGVGTTALWKSMWEDAEDERFRYVAIGPLCADPDPSVQPIIREILHYEGRVDAKSHCLGGLWYRDTEQTVDAIFGAVGVLQEENSLDEAVAALAVNRSSRARAFVHQFILNPENNETDRRETLAKLCNRPHPDDIAIFRRFLAGPVSMDAKRRALSSMGSNCALEHIRPVLLEILTQPDGVDLIGKAALALTLCYYRAERVDESELAADLALFETLSRREDLPEATRVHLRQYVTKIPAHREGRANWARKYKKD